MKGREVRDRELWKCRSTLADSIQFGVQGELEEEYKKSLMKYFNNLVRFEEMIEYNLPTINFQPSLRIPA